MKQLDVRQFNRLPLAMRDQVQAWLREEGFSIDSVFHMELLDDGMLNIYRFLRNAEGKRYMDHSINAPAQECIHHKIKAAPPEGVFT